MRAARLGSACGPLRAAAAAALALPLLACWEEPVDQRLTLCIAAGGQVVATARATIARDDQNRAALRRRLADTRREYEQGDDPWSRRFARLTPALERLTWERAEGELVEAVRTAVLAEPADVGALFSELGAGAALEARDGQGELEILPGPAGGRTTAEQRRRLARELEGWSADVAAYQDALSALYRGLDERPGEVRTALAELLREALPEGVDDGGVELADETRALIEAARSERRRVLRILEVPDGEDSTLNERAREVYDPFPALLDVVLPARPEEVEGFLSLPDGTLEIPRLDLLAALGRLEDRWVRPDPLPDYVRALRDPRRRGLDLAALAARERRSGPVPDPAAVRAAVEQELVPAPRYRARWTAPEAADDELALPCWRPPAGP